MDMQARTARLVFLSLSLFLVLMPLGVVRPGWPPTLKADEPAYFGMAQSLAFDFDVRCDFGDARRLTDAYPYLPINNLILMSDDGWETVYYGKPYAFSLLAAPAVRLFGQNGMVAVNILLLLGMIWMGTVYLARFNGFGLAMAFSTGFFVLSTAFAYVFWLQPEIFNMFSVCACLFLAFHRPEPSPRNDAPRRRWLRVLGSGAVLALAVYNKPVFAAMGVPALFAVYRRRGWKAAAAWIAAAAIALGLLAGLGYALSGHPTAYLGAARGGVRLEDPQTEDDYLEDMRRFVQLRGDEKVNAWTWIFRIPELAPRELAENVGYFFWGRHTGALFYTPLAALAFLLFLAHSPRSASRWLLVASAATVALFFIVFIPFNWHGGGGFVGNRYFINVYPAFLFLVTRIRPTAVLPAAFAVGGLLLGPVIFTPFGAPVPSPTLQAHTRNFPFRELPLELSVKKNVPGYSGTNLGGVRLLARTDLVRTWKQDPGRIWLQGGGSSEVLMLSLKRLDSVLFEVESLAPENRVRLELPGAEREVRFGPGEGEMNGATVVELAPSGFSRITFDGGKPVYVYELHVEIETGALPRHKDGRVTQPPFYLGASLTYLGRREQLEGEEHYRVSWRSVSAEERTEPGGTVLLLATVRNDGKTPWSSDGPVPVNLAYHWLDQDGGTVDFEGQRTALPEQIEPGMMVEIPMRVKAPRRPGRYVLVLDLVRENVAWFSSRGADTHRVEIEVAPAEPDPEAP